MLDCLNQQGRPKKLFTFQQVELRINCAFLMPQGLMGFIGPVGEPGIVGEKVRLLAMNQLL